MQIFSILYERNTSYSYMGYVSYIMNSQIRIILSYCYGSFMWKWVCSLVVFSLRIHRICWKSEIGNRAQIHLQQVISFSFFYRSHEIYLLLKSKPVSYFNSHKWICWWRKTHWNTIRLKLGRVYSSNKSHNMFIKIK